MEEKNDANSIDSLHICYISINFFSNYFFYNLPIVSQIWTSVFASEYLFLTPFYKRKSQMRKKDSQVIGVFLRFWDLPEQKLYVECWWNWALMSYAQFVHKNNRFKYPDERTIHNQCLLHNYSCQSYDR